MFYGQAIDISYPRLDLTVGQKTGARKLCRFLRKLKNSLLDYVSYILLQICVYFFTFIYFFYNSRRKMLTSCFWGKWRSCSVVFCANVWAICTQERRLWTWIYSLHCKSVFVTRTTSSHFAACHSTSLIGIQHDAQSLSLLQLHLYLFVVNIL